jgi:hypothetical protein
MYDKGTKVIIRGTESGVHHGTLADYSLDGGWVRLENSRRLWSWKTANDGISLTEIAIAGIDQKESKITDTLPDIIVMGVCEIIPTFGMADVTIEGAPVAKA